MALRIYTKTGDDGTTALFGGTRVSKDALRIQAYGTIDELNAVIGIVLTGNLKDELRAELGRLSRDLFSLGSDLATPLEPPPKYPIPRITVDDVARLEGWIDAHDDVLAPLKNFILPGGSFEAAHLHLARTVCRRAERLIVTLDGNENIGEHVRPFVNRLSDYLFTVARRANHDLGVSDVEWHAEDKP
jgi:cob(I)alamin adenosyltransferase